MRSLRLTVILLAAAALQSAFGEIIVSNPTNLILTGPVLTLPGANNGAGQIADVTGGNAGILVPYTETGNNFYSSGRAGTYGAQNLNDGDVGTGVNTDGFHAIPSYGTNTVVMSFVGGSKTITSIAIYHGYDNRDGFNAILKDASGTIIGEWQSKDTDDVTEHYWLKFPTPVTTTGLTIETTAGVGAGTTPSFREIQVFNNRVFWKGIHGLWNAANWSSDAAGTIATAIPSAPMHVQFPASGTGNKSTALGQDFTISGLTVSDGSVVTVGGVNALTVTGATTVASGTLVLPYTYSAASHVISSGATLELNVASGSRNYGATSFTGNGTLRKSGNGQAKWEQEPAVFSLGSGALIDVQSGNFLGGSFANEVWTANLSDLTVATGATFDGLEANVRVDSLNGAGLVRTGYQGAGYVNFTLGVDNGTGTFSGVLANSYSLGNFQKTGSGTQTLSGATPNTYTGTTTVDNGTLVLGKSAGIAAIVGPVQMGSGPAGKQPNLRMTANGQFGPNVVMTFVNPVGSNPRFDLQGTTQTLAGIVDSTGAGVVQNERLGGGGTAAAGTLTLNGTGTYSFNGILRDEDDGGAVFKLSLVKNGSGTQTLSGGTRYTGGTTISAGTLVANETIAAAVSATGSGPVTVNGTGTLAGGNAAGTVGSVRGNLSVASGGKLSPGIAGAGIFTVNGNATFASGATLQLDITGTTLGSQYDHVKASGTVALGDATLALTGGFVPTLGQEFVIINNTGAAAVSATFAGLPEASSVTFNGIGLVISYVGGDGNDVTLRAPYIVTNALDSGAGSLRQAIADATPGGAIVFDPATMNGQTLTLTSGELLIEKDLTFSASALSAGLTISGNNASRIFRITAGSTVAMNGLTLTGGQTGTFSSGGAIDNAGTLTLDTMTFDGNRAHSAGGAIRNLGSLTINRSAFFGNATSNGGGGAIDNSGSLIVTHSTFTRNHAAGRGGAINNAAFAMNLSHCTISGNRADESGGGGGLYTQPGGAVTLENTIIAANLPSTPLSRDWSNNTATITTLGRNLIGNNFSVEAQFPVGPLVGTNDNPLDPKLSALGYYGGPTQSMHPLIDSPAIDPAGGSTTSASATDQRGFARVVDGNNPPDSTATVDIGAVEAGTVLRVSNNAGDFSAGSLRTHLNTASLSPTIAYRLVFDPAVFPATITKSNTGQINTFSSTVFLDASDIGGTGVQISGGNSFQLFRISGGTTAMHSLTIRDGSGSAPAVMNFGSFTAVNCTISGHSSTNSGVIWNANQAVLDHCTVAGNHSVGLGVNSAGGILTTSEMRLTHCTVSGNEADEPSNPGGLYHYSGTLVIEDSIVAGNTAPNYPDISSDGGITPKGANVIGSSIGHALTGPLIGVDAKLLPLGNYGGPTQTMPPGIGSPAINAATGLMVYATDQRGAPRVIGTASDLGATEALIETLAPAPGSGFAIPQPITWTGAVGATFEVFFGTAAQGPVSRGNQTSPFTPSPPLDFGTDYILRIDVTLDGETFTGETITFSTRPLNPVVTTLDDENDGLDVGGISLREALAVVTDGETITFAPGLSGGVMTLANGQLLIDSDVTVDASGLDSGITINANGSITGHRVLEITPGNTVVISSLTLTGGAANGVAPNNNGGGIYCVNSSLTLIDTTVANNSAASIGGGIDLVGGNLFVNRSVVTGNSATFQCGGIFQDGGTSTFTDSTLAGNTTPNNGGGIYVTNSGVCNLINCLVVGNTSSVGGGGGGIMTYGSAQLHLVHTTVVNNTAPGAGGGIRQGQSNVIVTLENSIVAGNTGGSSPDISGAVNSYSGVNFIGNPAGASNLGSLGIDYLTGDPQLADLGYYGGPTKTMPPLPGSPVIDAGGATSLLADQRGFPRVIGGTVDIGAVEAGSADFEPDGLTLTTQGAANLTLLEISTDPNFLNTVGPLAGTGETVFADGPRDTATFNHPSGVTEDSAGNLYVADTGNHRIRKIDKLTGLVSTIAGSGSFGFADGAGPTARFAFPAAVAVTADGGIVYVSDTINHRIRKLTKPAVVGQPWTVTTLAGTGVAGLTEGAGSVARFNHPHGLIIDDSGALLVADKENNRIRKVSAAGISSTYYFEDILTIYKPTGLVLDSAGNLFVAEPDYNLIWKIAEGTLAISNFAGGSEGFIDGTGTNARFNEPVSLAIDGDDNLYVSDQKNHAIRKITSARVVTTVAPVGVAPTPSSGSVDGNSTIARFDGPSGLLVDSDGFLIVADTGNNRLRRVSIEPLTVATTHNAGTGMLTAEIDAISLDLTPGQTYYFRWLPEGGGTPVVGTSFQVLLPPTVVTDPASLLTSTGGQLNATVNPQGSNTTVIFEYSTDPALRGPWQVATLPPGTLTDPQGVAVFGGITYVADQAAHAIYTVDELGVATLFAGAANGAPGFADGTSTAARFDSPAGLAVDTDGNLFVADRVNHCIRKITPGGEVSTLAGSGLAGFVDGADDVARFLFPQGVAVFGNNVYVADTNNHRIRRIDKTTGAVTTLAGNGTAAFADGAGTSARFNSPRAVAVNATGQLHVADTGNHRIRLLTAGNSVVTLAGDGTAGFLDGADTGARFNSPAGLVINSAGTIYVTDQENHRIRSITVDGLVGTVAGSGVAGLLDSPGGSLHPATAAKLASPGGIALDADGNLIISEETSNRLRRIDRAPLPTLETNPNISGASATPVYSVIDQLLLPGATYYFRAIATNGRGTVEGEIIRSFTTPQSNIVVHNGPTDASPLLVPDQVVDFGTTPFNTPVIRTFTIKNIGSSDLSVTGVTLTGSPAGVFSLSGQTGVFAIAAGATGAFQVTLDHGTAGTFTKTVSIASNDLDQPAIEFEVTGTVLAPPLLTDVAASDVTALGVTFAGTANPQGSATEVLFEYSKDPDFAGALEVLTTSGSTQGFANGCGGEAKYNAPSGVAVDRFGNIYVADTGNHSIRRIAANGDCTVLAGSGEAGSTNDVGILASFNAPEGVAVDAAGIVYVADTGNHRIRRITPAGVVTTLAGFGITGAFTDGALSGARFNAPAGIAIDATGNLFIADTGNNRIRKISSVGEVSTFAGPAGYSSPKGVAVDGDGRVCVADTGNNRIVRFTATDPQITTGFTAPTGVAIDAAGLIYVADRSAHRIARIGAGGAVTTLAGTPDVSGTNDGSGADAKFNLPTGIAVSPTGTIYLADSNNHRIRRITLAARRVVAATNLTSAPDAPVTLTLVGLEPSTTYYYRGIAINGGGTVFTDPVAPAPLTFTTLDNNAGLAELSLNGTPIPNFNPCAYSYPVTIDSPQNSMIILAESSSPDAQMQLFKNGEYYSDLESGVPSAPLPLASGLNPFQIVVISADNTNSRTYAVAATSVQTDSGFAQWQTLKFGADAGDPLIAGALANPDKDSSVNLLEYAFDLDPNISSAGGLPFIGKSGGFLSLTYRRRVDATDLVYKVQWSTDLVEWFETGITEELATAQGAGLTEEIRGKIPDTGPRKFLRVSVDLN
jgi:autotransporter-associated beta strand protein